MEIDGKKIQLFTLSANKQIAEEISKESGIPLSSISVARFADGEINLNIEDSVRGNHIFVVQPTSNPVNEHLMELLIMTDALKRASAASITLIVPYFGYSRQDRKSKSRQPITAKLVANLIETAGANRVVSIDLHAAQIQGFFDIPIDNFPAAPLLASYFQELNMKNIVVVSPDHGGATRARGFARFFEAPIAIIDKRRPSPNETEVMNVIGEVKGKTCIVIDDMIDTGGTLIEGAKALIKNGAKEVYACATHGVFSRDALDRLENSCVKKVVVTNTIYHENIEKYSKIKVLGIGNLLGRSILNIISDQPISQIFENIYKDNPQS
ncbi:MAG: ribose-phosphate diphosphokinase [Acholeplasmatales bacterium]